MVAGLPVFELYDRKEAIRMVALWNYHTAPALGPCLTLFILFRLARNFLGDCNLVHHIHRLIVLL